MLQIGWLVGFGLMAFGMFAGAFQKGRSIPMRVVLILSGVLFTGIALTALTMRR
jgi:threonine/homoserine/homoserine lactone efflux protein